MDEKSMTGIMIGVCIALACIVTCIFILITKSKTRYYVDLMYSTSRLLVVLSKESDFFLSLLLNIAKY